MNWIEGLETIIKAASDVLTAGVAIVAFSLLIFAITFKNWEKVTLSFTMIILCVMVIFGADSFTTALTGENFSNVLIKIHWLGLIFLPVFYFLFSDALLTMTGKPSRGRRRIVGYISCILGLGFTGLLVVGKLIGDITIDKNLGIYIEKTYLNDLFSLFFAGTLSLSWWNFIRTYQRTLTKASRRRMLYLIVSSIGPAIGSFPYLLYGSRFAINHPMIYWFLLLLSTTAVYFTLIAMTYSVAFFGFSWSDRVIKSRLFRWVMRGPITASLTLGATTLISRLGDQLAINVSALVIIAMVAIIVLFEYFITLFAPIWERMFFYGKDRSELEKIRMLEDRLLTNNDIKQFLELTLASLCDRLQITQAALIVHPSISNDLDTQTKDYLRLDVEKKNLIFSHLEEYQITKLFHEYNRQVIFPIVYKKNGEKDFLGLILVDEKLMLELDEEKKAALKKLLSRAALALEDRQQQGVLVSSLEMLTPRVSVIQNLLASSRRDQTRMMNGDGHEFEQKDIEKWIKDALTHLWGGPKMSKNPIIQLSIVQDRIIKQNETPMNAVRTVLREAVNNLKPEGERLYTNEWILFNLLDLKYFEGWKVKDIARKLALSEADFYRKQRIAISAISKSIIESENRVSPQ